MKKIIPCLLCVFFILLALQVDGVFAYQSEILNFSYQGRVFTYTLNENLKLSNVFDTNYEINKLNRFSSRQDRQTLLRHLLSIGIDKSVALEYLFPNINKKINSIAKNINTPAKNAQIKLFPNKEKVFHVSPDVSGFEVDIIRLQDDIIDNYLNDKSLNFTIPVNTLSPKIKQQELKKHTYLRGDFSTDISTSSTDRKHNIKNALESLNKVEILPDQTFSFNKTVGRRTAENGYRLAKIIVNNEFVEGLGGGVCQVSSTLYNAALLSGLEIIEANKHSKQVGYVKSGFDAMVNFGSSDLRFKNNTNEKLTIITNYSPTRARIRIFGENMQGISYKLSNEIVNVVQPVEEVIVDNNQQYIDKIRYCDEFFYLKNGVMGMEIFSYRKKYNGDILIHIEQLRHDKYKQQNAIKVYGSLPRTLTEKSTEEICA